MTKTKFAFPALFAAGASVAATLVAVSTAEAAPNYRPTAPTTIKFRSSQQTIVMTAKPLPVRNGWTYTCALTRQAKNSNAAPGGPGGKVYRTRGKGPVLTVSTEKLAPGAYNVFGRCDFKAPNLPFGAPQLVTTNSQRVLVR